MATSVYKFNKGINKPIEFKGIKAQYIWYLGGGLVFLLVAFAFMYIIGVNIYIGLFIILLLGTFLFVLVNHLSHKHGQYGMMKWLAKKGIPSAVRCTSRVTFLKLIGKRHSND